MQRLPDNRTFGYFFAFVFLLAGAYSFFASRWNFVTLGALVAALLFLLIAALRPMWLIPLNKAWMALGELLGRIVSPVVLGAIFFLLITPVAIVMRLAGRDALSLRRRATKSCWVGRTPPGPDSDSFKNQF